MSHFFSHPRRLLVLIALGIACLADRPAHAQYSVKDLGILQGYDSFVHGINNSGQIAVNGRLNGNRHAFISDINTEILHDLGTLGGLESFSGGINALGQVTGSAELPDFSGSHAFLSDPNGGTLKDLGTLEDGNTSGGSVNLYGQVVGNVYLPSGREHAFLSDVNGGVLHDLGTLGGLQSFGYAVNDLGEATGYSETTLTDQYGRVLNHAFFSTANGMALRDMGTLGGDNSYGTGVNNSGQVTGGANSNELDLYSQQITHAFLSGANGGSLKDLGTLAGNTSYGLSINDSGQVVGYSTYSTEAPSNYHAFLFTGGVMADLNTLIPPGSGFTLYQAFIISNNGLVVSTGYDSMNQMHSLLLIPLPRPSALTATVSGNEVVLKWKAAAGSVLHYDVYRGTTPGGETLYKSAGTATTFTNGILTKGTPYFYTVKAVSSAGTSFPANEVTATVPAIPAAPAHLTATVVSGQVKLTWTAPAGPVSSYHVYRSTTSGSETDYKTVTATTYTNGYVTHGTTYYYTVKAVNSAGYSPASNEAHAMP